MFSCFGGAHGGHPGVPATTPPSARRPISSPTAVTYQWHREAQTEQHLRDLIQKRQGWLDNGSNSADFAGVITCDADKKVALTYHFEGGDELKLMSLKLAPQG